MAEYIDREAVMRLIDEETLCANVDNEERTVDALLRLKDRVETEIRPADAAPVVHAHWIDTGRYACGETEYKCSGCHETEWRTNYTRMKWCMFCGAKMDEVTENG